MQGTAADANAFDTGFVEVQRKDAPFVGCDLCDDFLAKGAAASLEDHIFRGRFSGIKERQNR